MDAKYVKAHDNILKAREALRRGDKTSARELGEQAALLIPELEDAWLILAASDPNPQEALAYAKKALQLKPDSARAKKAVEWATGLANQASGRVEPQAVVAEKKPRQESIPAEEIVQHNAVTAFPRYIPRPVEQEAQPEPKSKKSIWIYASVFGVLVCAVLGIAAWSAFSSPVLASFLGSPAPTQENLWASVSVPKPSNSTIDVSAFAPTPTDVPSLEPTEKPGEISPTKAPTKGPAVTDTATPVPTDALTSTPEITETPGTMAMEIVNDTPTAEYGVPNADAPKPSAASNGARWIDVDLTQQMVYAYEGETVVNSFLVSTGTWRTPTVTGEYKIYVKYSKANMRGPGYFLPDVPYVMYFYQSYGLHGTYWHHNFGTPMSHGCVNLETSNAQWLFNWASVGTVVNVHY
jgi:lipoprotein-anchoring transpeptidase ErfK/SrfK